MYFANELNNMVLKMFYCQLSLDLVKVRNTKLSHMEYCVLNVGMIIQWSLVTFIWDFWSISHKMHAHHSPTCMHVVFNFIIKI